MRELQQNKVYRHFKGNYYYIEGIATNSETKEEYVIYRALYGEDRKLWIRPKEMFLEKIDALRQDNITGQTYRFEYVEEINSNHLK